MFGAGRWPPVTALGESSVTLTVQARCTEAWRCQQVQFDLLEQAKIRFQDEGIEVLIPTATWSSKGKPLSA